MKKTKQMQEEMLYGTMVKTPSKRRIGGTPTPGKMKRVNGWIFLWFFCNCVNVKHEHWLKHLCPLSTQLNGTSTFSTPTSFLSSGLSGTMCLSSTQKPPLSASKVLCFMLFLTVKPSGLDWFVQYLRQVWSSLFSYWNDKTSYISLYLDSMLVNVWV